MRICVFGSGYVGLVIATCFAELGNQVTCVDIDEQKIHQLQGGKLPIYEPGLGELVKKNLEQKRLEFTTQSDQAVKNNVIQFITVGTPPLPNGEPDMRFVHQVAEVIGKNLQDFAVVINKSTVPVGTVNLVQQTIQQELDARKAQVEFCTVSNPEFLREGNAVNDFFEPDRIIIGTPQNTVHKLVQQLYQPFLDKGCPMLVMDPTSAELSKYAANAFLATKISFINEFANLCQNLNANIDFIRKGISLDKRIGADFLNPGIGYGGSCFPKDIQAILNIAKNNHSSLKVIQAVKKVNDSQTEAIVRPVVKFLEQHQIKQPKLAVWGITFKPQTDDLREAPAIKIINELLKLKVQICVHDPVALDQARQLWQDQISYQEDPYLALDAADALLLLTEWSNYRQLDFNQIQARLKRPVIFDGRNFFNVQVMKDKGFNYFSIGRPSNL